MLNGKYFHKHLASLFRKLGRLSRSGGLIRMIALLLVFGNVVTTSGMTLVNEVFDENNDPVVIEETTETEETDAYAAETSSENTDATDPESADSGSADPSSDTTSEDTEIENNTTEEIFTEKSFRGDSYTVTVNYGSDTGIPSDAELVVREITSAEEYEKYCSQISDVFDPDRLSYLRFFDISLTVDGTEIEPAENTTVTVQIVFDEYIADEISVIHLPENEESAVIDTDVTSTDEGTAVRFDTDGFSAYAIVAEPGLQNTDDGWVVLTTIADVGTYAGRGIYIRTANPDGGKYRYMSNRETKVNSSRYGITKTRYAYLSTVEAMADIYPAVPFFFEDFTISGDGNSATFKLYCYADDGQTIQYLKEGPTGNNTNSMRLTNSSSDATTFTIVRNNNHFNIYAVRNNTNYYLNEQGDAGWGSGDGPDGTKKSFSSYAGATGLDFFAYSGYSQEPYGLDGKTYGLLSWNGAENGRLLMSDSSNANALDALPITVATKEGSNNLDKIFITSGEDATMWTFHWTSDNKYNITADVGGETKYLTVTSSGLSVSSTPAEVEVIPGTDTASGKIRLKSGNNVITYSGQAATGFNANGTGSSWFDLVEETQITNDYKKTYSAKKISVSDPTLKDGDQVIIYTRVWNDTNKTYDYYAVDQDGTLVKCRDSGDYLQWTETLINSLIWDLTIYHWEGTTPTKENENGYYELQNEYSNKYIAPQISSGQFLSDNKIGIQLTGRDKDKYYSPIFAWDDLNYAYSSLTVDTSGLPASGSIAAGEYVDAVDFYFAILQDAVESDEQFHEVETVDNNKYGITLKMQDFTDENAMNVILGSSQKDQLTQGILSTNLGDDGYPTTLAGRSLKDLYNAPVEINHLFIKSVHDATGYFEFDSTQNFATIDNGRFIVYQELATHDQGTPRSTLKHGQFLPYNMMSEGVFAVKNPRNLYTMHARMNNANAGLLPDGDPRKYEPLYLISNPDFQFGMELETSFIQTTNGLDDWGHDIIYEFTGDDDFWLYVDGELVIDLGGMHSAFAGSVNFATGEVIVEGNPTTLRDIFYNNYLNRDNHTAAEAQAYVDGIFVPNGQGGYVFRDYTTHSMRCFYTERGGGGSNLHMKFNQSSITPGTVLLSKEVTGTDNFESVVAQFPYQIFYTKKNPATGIVEEYPITNTTGGDIYVFYKGTTIPVEFEPAYTIGTETYNNVFFLKSGEECEISFPDKTINYRVVECGVDPDLYSKVYINNSEVTASATHANGLKDYDTGPDEVENRTNVAYVNEVDPDALRTLTIQKVLYNEDHTQVLTAADDDTTFSFRLYLNGEYDPAITLANKGSYAAYMYPYKIIDANGNYCRWDSGQQKFVSIGVGPSGYSTLSDSVKRQITFYTSMNGSISKIPAGYTVEVKGLLVGSHYMVEERDYEIPDGFSRNCYEYYEDVNGSLTSTGDDPVSEALETGKDPKVTVENLKGYGIRANKIWTDTDYMISHGDSYYAVYTMEGTTETRVSDIHCINSNQNSTYWYFEHLLAGHQLSDYYVREVKLEGGTPVVDSNGVVTGGYSQVTPVSPNGTITIPGQMIGDSSSASYTYTVTYEQGVLPDGSNVRLDKVINDRPGIQLMKTTWDGTPLPGASFTLASQDGIYRKTFIAGTDGKITKAFLRVGEHYFLTEIRTPTGHTCPGDPIEIWIDNNGDVHVDDPSSGDRFGLQNQSGVLVIRNNDCVMNFIKTDDMGNALPGAHFALHKQVSVGGITMFDFDPLTGYEDMVSDNNGVIQELNSTLPAGVYELREQSAPTGYTALPYNVRFRITDTNELVLLNNYADVILTETYDNNGVMTYEMQLQNSSNSKKLTITKTVSGNVGSRDLSFPYTLTLTDTADQPYQGVVIAHYGNGTNDTFTLDSAGSCSFSLAHGESVFFNLPADTKYTIDEDPQGYTCYYKIGNGSVQEGHTATGILTADTRVEFTNDKSAILPTGVNLSVNLLVRIMLALLGCVVTVVYFMRRRKRFDME